MLEYEGAQLIRESEEWHGVSGRDAWSYSYIFNNSLLGLAIGHLMVVDTIKNGAKAPGYIPIWTYPGMPEQLDALAETWQTKSSQPQIIKLGDTQVRADIFYFYWTEIVARPVEGNVRGLYLAAFSQDLPTTISRAMAFMTPADASYRAAMGIVRQPSEEVILPLGQSEAPVAAVPSYT